MLCVYRCHAGLLLLVLLLLLRLNLLDLRLDLLPIDAREQNLGRIGHLCAACIQAEFRKIVVVAKLPGKLCCDAVRRLGQEALKKRCADQNRLGQVVQNLRKAVLLGLVLRKRPRRRLVDILVAALKQRENLRDCVRHAKVVHLRRHTSRRAGDNGLEIVVNLLRHAGLSHNAVKILVAHGDRAVHEISERVCKVGVGALRHKLPRDYAVVIVRHLVKHEISRRVHTEDVDQIVCVDDVALGLAHLVATLQKPRVSEHLLRKRNVQRHQEDRPVNRVEADDVLADQMKVRRPELLELLRAVAVRVIADSGDIVRKRIEPYIHDVLVVEINRNAPFEGRSRHAQILQAGQQEVVHHLILAALGLNELGMRVDMLNQAVRILAHLEEVRLLLRRLHRPSAVGTATVHQLRLRPERLAGRAVQAFIAALVNVALLIHLPENLLNLEPVVRIRGADEFVVRGVDAVPDSADLAGGPVDKFLRRQLRLKRLDLILLSMFVRARLKEHVVALVALKARDGIRQDCLVGVADVRLARCIRDCRCDVIRLLLCHCFVLLD